MAKNDKQVKRGVYLYIDGKEVKNDVNAIATEIKKLQREIKDMTIGSEEYNRTMAKIKNLQGILRQHQKEIRGVTAETKKATLSIGRMVDGFNRFSGVILSAIGFLTGFTLALRAIRDERNKLEESQAGLKALTGLDDDSISWLTEQAKTLSTTMTKEGLRVRQSAAEILDAFMLVGSAKPELLGDKEALKAVTEEAMRLQAAAKDIKLNEAVDALTLSLNQYGASADQASRFVNVLAAGSKEGAANIASQAAAIKKAGTIAASSNIPIEELVGTIEMLGEKGVKDEVAGTGLKTFFTRLATGAADTNPKVVGLATALENLNEKVAAAEAKTVGGGTSLLKNLFGDEGMQTAMILSQNTEQVKKYTAAVTDTNVAIEQSAINSDTAAAKLAQARNNMKLAAIDLAEKLNPALTVSTNMVTNVVKYLPGLIDWCQKWGGTVLYVSSCIVLYTLRTRIASTITVTWNAITKTATALQLAYGIALNTVSGYTVTSFTQLRKLSTLLAGHNILLKTVRVSTYLFAGSMQVLQGRVDLAAKSMRAAWAVMKLNPAGILSTALFAGGAAFLYLYKRANEYLNVQKATNKLQKEAIKSTTEQRGKLDALWRVAQNNNNTMKARKEAMEKINKIAPDYLGDITLETINTQKAADAKARYVEQLQKEAMLKGASTHIEEESKKLVEYQAELDKALAGQKKAREGATYAQTGFTAYDATVEQLKFDIAHTKEAIKNYMTIYEQLDKELNGSGKKQTNKNPENQATNENSGSGSPESEEEREKRVKKELEDIETRHMQQLTHLQKLYLEGQIQTDEEYTALQIDLEKKTLDEKLAVAGLEAHEREKLQVKMLEAQIKFNEECKRQDEKAEQERQKAAEKTAKERLSIRQKQLRIELEDAAASHYKNLTSEEDFAKEVNGIRQRYWDDLLHNYQLTEEQRTEIQKEQSEAQAKAEKEKYDKTMEMHKQYASLVTDIASDFGETIGEMIANGELTMKNFLRETILMALDALERVIEISILEITAKNLAATAPLSFIGAAKAAVQVAAIKASFAVVKGLVGNFYTGGYTPSGSWNQPQGIVHSNEFVANRFAVANPNLRPIFDVIDMAQRTGNVGNLTADDIAAVAGSRRTVTASPAGVGASSAATTTNDPATLAVMKECIRVMRRLKVRLDEPLIAETYVTGKNGINQAQRDYQRLKNNKSRNKQ